MEPLDNSRKRKSSSPDRETVETADNNGAIVEETSSTNYPSEPQAKVIKLSSEMPAESEVEPVVEPEPEERKDAAVAKEDEQMTESSQKEPAEVDLEMELEPQCAAEQPQVAEVTLEPQCATEQPEVAVENPENEVDGISDKECIETQLEENGAVMDTSSDEKRDAEPMEKIPTDPTGDVPSSKGNDVEDQSCVIRITFHNESIAKLYKMKFLTFINAFNEFKVQSSDGLKIDIQENDISSSLPEPSDVNNENIGCSLTPSAKRKKHSKVKRELFVLDAKPSKEKEADMQYTSKFMMSNDKKETSQPVKQQTCFNCDKPHALKDCPERKDYSRINAARQKYYSQSKSSRYHLEEDQKYSHLEPGKVSSELRKALGLRKNEAPPYIYLMRKLGYPPGWLEEAKFVHSNLNIFGIDGNNVNTSSAPNQGLDRDKIVDYPGFNVPFEKGLKDDFKTYRVAPYSDVFSKDAMIKFFNERVAKIPDENSKDVELKPDITHQIGTVKNKQHTVLETDDDRDSPSLKDLEQQKRQLLEELQNASVVDTSLKLDDPDAKVNPSTTSLKNVKETCFGTPILKGSSPYMRLPDSDNFTKDVSPVINFENLPNSTGKYEQMTDVLQKVRSTLKKIQNVDT